MSKQLSLVLLLLIVGCSASSSRDDDASVKPDETRFTPVVLAEGETMDEPMAFDVTDDGRVFIAERKGGVKRYDPQSGAVSLLATIPVNTKYTSAEGTVREAEEGLVGISLDPGYDENRWIYLLYADPSEPKHVLSRWEVGADELVAGSEKVMLEYPVQREACCHTGGGMTWDADGNLYVTVGNNTGNSQASQTDERPGRSSWDDQRGAANTNDLRGKILRIHPEDDGTYTIPEGNLFPPGTSGTRPEIYTMGHRNAWRVSVDSETGYLYWGEVGPDATLDTEIGPRGYDEFNQAREPGNYGWPYFIGANHAFPYFDYTDSVAMAPKDAAAPINSSVNNTGLNELPPAQPAFIAYPYGVSEEFPDMGTGGRSAVGGPVYRRDEFQDAPRRWPAYFEGKWLAADLARGWIMAISMDENGDYAGMERILTAYQPAEIIDLKFGPEGDLYVLEYGANWFRDSPDDKLVRIEYNAGNRTPLAVASAEMQGGTVPFTTTLSADGSVDYDGDDLAYRWEVAGDAGAPHVLEGANPSVTLDQAGVYTATLTVTDPDGAAGSRSIRLIAGNEPPEVSLDVTGNRTFFFSDTPLRYDVGVRDHEDGSLGEGDLLPAHVAVSIDYLSEGFDYAEIMQGQRSVDASTRYAVAQALMAQTDCGVCHQTDIRSAGPSFVEIAERYRTDTGAEKKLAEKVIAGGNGVWGEINMPAHPAITMTDATTMVNYILHVNDETAGTLPTSGSYTPSVPEGDNGRGTVIIRAAYTDQGAGGAPSHTAEDVRILHSPAVSPADADVLENARIEVSGRGGDTNVLPQAGGYIGFDRIDLTGIRGVEVVAVARSRSGTIGGTIEARLDSPTGQLVGQTTVAVSEGGWGGGSEREPNIIEIEKTDGVHDLYFVFKNDAARPIDPLMSLSRIIFMNQ